MALRKIDRAMAQKLALMGRGVAIVALLGAGVVTLADVPGAAFRDPEIRQPVLPENGDEPETAGIAPRGPSFDPELIEETLLALKNAPKREEAPDDPPVIDSPRVQDGPEDPPPPTPPQANALDGYAYLGGVKDRLGRRAFISVNGTQHLVAAGDEIEGWTVASVGLDEIVFEQSGRRETLERLQEARDLSDLSPAERRSRAQNARGDAATLQNAVAERGRLGVQPAAGERQAGAGTLSPSEMREFQQLRRKDLQDELTDAERARLAELADRFDQQRTGLRETPR